MADKTNVIYEIDSRESTAFTFDFPKSKNIPTFQIVKGLNYLTKEQFEALKTKSEYSLKTKTFEASKMKNVGWVVREVSCKNPPVITNKRVDAGQVDLIKSLETKEAVKAISENPDDGIENIDVLKRLAEDKEDLVLKTTAETKIENIRKKNSR
jgi:hypothetical protein